MRRLIALVPDGTRGSLADVLRDVVGDMADACVDYALDPKGGAILATTAARQDGLASPAFQWVGPGNAAPVHDAIAAVIAGPKLVEGTNLAARAWERRFAPRADDAIAAAVAALPAAAREAVLERLFEQMGPDEDVLALATVQCGRVIAWSPELADTAVGARVIEALLALLVPERPRPLLLLVAQALAPIAAKVARVRDAAMAGVKAGGAQPAPRSFADEVAQVGKTRTVPEQDRMMALPKKEVGEACAYILGFAAPVPSGEFAAYRARVLGDTGEFLEPFVDGLIEAAHVGAVSELVVALLTGEDDDVYAGFGLATRLPCDPVADLIAQALDDPHAGVRALAAEAAELLGTEDFDIDPVLSMRLGDPIPEVTAAAARTLLERGRRDILGRHSAREVHAVRRAVVLATLGELGVPVIGELARGLVAGLEGDGSDEDSGASPIARLMAQALLCSIDGLGVAADLITSVPETAGVLALAAASAGRDIGVLAPPGPRATLATSVLGLATSAAWKGEELVSLALYVLARVSAGDETIADVIAEALTTDDGFAGNLVGALGELRTPTAAVAKALAPLLDPSAAIGSRVAAAAVAGRALPATHDAWAHVRDLLSFGTVARAAAWSALRDRARRS